MNKCGRKKQKKKKTLKRLKSDFELLLEDKNFDKATLISLDIINLYPKSTFGYLWYIKLKTKYYKKYLNEEEIKDLRKKFEKLYEISSKKERKKLKIEFDEYTYDCKEVYNLEKTKKEIIEKCFLKKMYEEQISIINKNIKIGKLYYNSGTKIKSFYDLIRGLFFAICLIFNLISRNYLLIITIPFGVFGIINIYSFIESVFLKKDYLDEESKKVNSFIEISENKIEDCKSKIKKIDEILDFLKEQKANSILKIPNSFKEHTEPYFKDDEDLIAKKLIIMLYSNKIDELCDYLKENTNIEAQEFLAKFNDSKLNNKEEMYLLLAEKNSKLKILDMKKMSIINIIITFILMFISISSLIIIINNFYELNFISFIMALIIGIISILTYNIETGKYTSVVDTFNDNLFICIFRSSLVYDLIYSWMTNELNFTYGFIEIPLIFMFIFIGFSMLISMFKYSHLYKKVNN